MPKILIDNQEVILKDNTSILHAAEAAGVTIPTLCYLKGYAHYTSCMLCVVVDKKTNKLIPSCSVYAEDGMEIETDSPRIKAARKDTIDMLLSEHVGDCEATCSRGCPANMNIPLMIRQIKDGNFEEAIKTVKNDIAFPAILGRICSAPCENACIHKLYDNAVSICKLERIVGDLDLAKKNPYKPEIDKQTNKKVAVVGAGPTGRSAAYYLQRSGNQVTLFDKFEKPGGMMKYGVPADRLDKKVLDNEISQIINLGVQFKANSELGKNIDFTELIQKFDALVLSMGTVDQNTPDLPGLDISAKGIVVDKNTFQTKISNVFAGGNTIRAGRSTIRSCAHGKLMAQSVNAYFKDSIAKVLDKRFNSTIGRVNKDELKEFVKGSQPHKRTIPADEENSSYTVEESVKESTRCFHCDCRKIDTCKLREYADLFKGNQKRFKITKRNSFKRIIQHEKVIYEPGKCIKCNLCVRITEKAGEELGLTMINRGFDIAVSTPFNESMGKGLQKTANEVVKACPTAALSFIKEENKD